MGTHPIFESDFDCLTGNMSDVSDDEFEKKEENWSKFKPHLHFTKEMYDRTIREITSSRDKFLKTQSEILAFMGKTDEAELAQQAAAQEQTAGTKRNRKKNDGKMTEEEIQEIESS